MKSFDPLAPDRAPLPRSPVQLYEICPPASLLNVHESVEDSPDVMIPGLKVHPCPPDEAPTVTLAAHVLVAPEPSVTVRVHVWLVEGKESCDPLGSDRVPLPRSPVQL